MLIFLFPPLYGEGYVAINYLLDGNSAAIVDGSFFYVDRDSIWFIAVYIGCIVLCKAFATSATNGAGGVGGTFAPSLYVGAMAGFLFAYVLNHLDLGIEISNKNFTLMGMAGVMSGVMHAPLMAIFLTAEMTGGYDLFLPLLIVSALAYGTVVVFDPYSIYTRRLAKRGELLTHHKDKAVSTPRRPTPSRWWTARENSRESSSLTTYATLCSGRTSTIKCTCRNSCQCHRPE